MAARAMELFRKVNMKAILDAPIGQSPFGHYRTIFAGQARLLAERAERGRRIDYRSVLNSLLAYILAIREGRLGRAHD